MDDYVESYTPLRKYNLKHCTFWRRISGYPIPQISNVQFIALCLKLCFRRKRTVNLIVFHIHKKILSLVKIHFQNIFLRISVRNIKLANGNEVIIASKTGDISTDYNVSATCIRVHFVQRNCNRIDSPNRIISNQIVSPIPLWIPIAKEL